MNLASCHPLSFTVLGVCSLEQMELHPKNASPMSPPGGLHPRLRDHEPSIFMLGRERGSATKG